MADKKKKPPEEPASEPAEPQPLLPSPPLPENEKTLFEGILGATQLQPVRTLAFHATKISSAHLDEKGDVSLDMPAFLRQEDAPQQLMMSDHEKFSPSPATSIAPFRYLTKQSGRNGQALTFWLDEGAMGRHIGEPITPAIARKMQSRLDDLLLALRQKHGLNEHTLEGRICLMSDAFREQTGHRVCAAIVLATTPERVRELQDEVRDTLEHARTTARLESQGKVVGKLGVLLQEPERVMRIIGNDRTLPEELQEEIKARDALREEWDAQQKAEQETQAAAERPPEEPKPSVTDELQRVMGSVVAPIHYVPLGPSKTVKAHVFDKSGEPTGCWPLNLTGAQPHNPVTHVLYCQLNDEVAREIQLRATTLPEGSTERLELEEQVRARFRPMIDYIQHRHDVKISFTPIIFTDENAPPMLVMIADTPEQDVLQDIARDLAEIGPHAHYAQHTPTEPEPEPEPGKSDPPPAYLQKDGMSEPVHHGMAQLLRNVPAAPQVRPVRPDGSIIVNVPAKKGGDRSQIIVVPEQPRVAQGATHKPTHLFTCWIDQLAFGQLHDRLRYAEDQQLSTFQDSLERKIEPLISGLQRRGDMPVRWATYKPNGTGPTLVMLAADTPEQEKPLQRFASRIAAAQADGRERAERTGRDDDGQENGL